jgi:hypothetical protein
VGPSDSLAVRTVCVTSENGFEHSGGPPTRGRSVHPFATVHAEEESRPGDPYREIPIGVPETPSEYEKRKRAAERPDPPYPDDDDAQIDQADNGGSRS